MKPFLKLCLIFLIWPAQVSAQGRKILPPVSAARITFDEVRFDFGDIPQWQPVSHTFHFTNTGSKPLFIYNVNRKCGCTTPRWTSGKIPPGGRGSVTITFNAQEIGFFEKEMTVSCNGVKEYTEIIVRGVVMLAPVPDSLLPFLQEGAHE
jgi:hypothetical protein